MCFNLPQKIILINNDEIIVQNHIMNCSSVKSIMDVCQGDFVLIQNNIIIEKIKKDKIKQIFENIETEELWIEK